MEEDKEMKEPEENEITSSDNTGIKISNDVVASIAGVAVSEVPGVYGMAGWERGSFLYHLHEDRQDQQGTLEREPKSLYG